ncbi:dedicator of cytokinesis protein 9 isoform X1, partial [Tachysurus ichikawai]
ISALEDANKSSLSDSLHIFKVISGSPGGSALKGLPSSASSV